MSIYDNPFAQRVLLVDLKPYSVAAAAVVTRYVGSQTFNTEPTDTPANVRYTGCIQNDVYISRSMFTGDNVGGRSIPDIAVLTIINTREPGRAASRFDAWLDPTQYTWQGREIVMWMIEHDAAYSTKQEVFKGIIDDIDYDENTITFRIRSRAYLLDKLIQENRYAGTGDAEGFAELAGRPKPICYGRCRNIEPVVIDSVNSVYQVHDGDIEEIEELRDRGNNNIAFYADFSTYATLVAASIPLGSYATCLDEGLFRLQSPPAGRITLDVKGAWIDGAYSAKPGDILRDIATERAEITNVDNDAIDALNTQVPGDIGIYLREDANILDVMDRIVNSYFGFYGFNRAGQFDVGVFAPPAGSPVVSIGERNMDYGSLSRNPVAQVVWKVTVYYRENFAPQTQEEFAGAVTQDLRDYYAETWMKDAVEEDATILTRYPNAIEKVFYSLHYDQNYAQSYAAALLTFFGTSRSLFKAQTNLAPLQVNINDNVELVHSRYNLANGEIFRMISLEEYLLTARTNIGVVG